LGIEIRKIDMTINPWDQASTPDEGDASEEITFLSVGRALTQWEKFEQNFAHIFQVCVTGATGLYALPATRAYGATISFQGRLAVLDAAVDAFVTIASYHDELDQTRVQAITRDFRALKNLASKYSPRRNEIAHGYVRKWWSLPPGEHNGYALFPTSYSTNKHAIVKPDEPPYLRTEFEWPGYVYTSKEIDAYGVQFSELATQAWSVFGHFSSTNASLRHIK
jgi:hypothetical protein